MRLSLLFILGVIGSFPCSGSAGETHLPGNDTGRIVLSPELHKILALEMQAIQAGMESLVSAIASGNWHEVSLTADKMRDSYIMKQRLSEAQREELHRALPPDFRELDREFHQLSGMLSHVAEEPHPELVTFYFYKLSEACVSCHAKYASHRFPAFKQSDERSEHHH